MALIQFQVSVDDRRWKKSLPDYKQIVEKSLQAISEYCVLNGIVSILLTNDEKIRELNKTYRNQDKPTNVLSFPDDENGMLGDIAMALETLEKEAGEQDKTFTDHFTHLFIHGVLHLMGHDHMEAEEQADMEALEIKILNAMGIDNPY